MTWTQAVLLTAEIWLAVFSVAWIVKKIIREWHAADIMRNAVANGDFDEEMKMYSTKASETFAIRNLEFSKIKVKQV